MYRTQRPELLTNPWMIPTTLAFALASTKLGAIADDNVVGLILLALFVLWFAWFAASLVTNRLIPFRFANEVFVLDARNNLAVIEHPYHKRLVPPGSRLGYHEAPHTAVKRVLREELGLEEDEYRLSPSTTLPVYKSGSAKVEVVQPPFQVQVETRQQRLGIHQHYDFLYACTVNGVRPPLRAPGARWMSVRELEDMSAMDDPMRTFRDVLPTLRELIRSRQGIAAEAGS